MAEEAPVQRRCDVLLRDVTADDLLHFYAHQLDPMATAMAAFPSRDRDAFLAHWQKILADETVTTKTVLVDGQVAGNVVSFDQDGEREVGYWLGREYWGRGIATRALAAFLVHEPVRPLYASVARHNRGSIRVLEKCGFVPFQDGAGFPDEFGDDVGMLVLRLDVPVPDLLHRIEDRDIQTHEVSRAPHVRFGDAMMINRRLVSHRQAVWRTGVQPARRTRPR